MQHVDLDDLRSVQGGEAISAALARIDAALQEGTARPDAGPNTPARDAWDRLLELKVTLLLRSGQHEAAFQLAEGLRHAWNAELQKVVTAPEFLEWRWIASTGTQLPPDVAGLDGIEWTRLASCRPARTGEVPFLLRALGGDQPGPAGEAFDILMDHIEHQGGTYEATPHAVRVLVGLLERGLITLPGLANCVRVALNRAGLFRHVPKANRDWVSIKKNPPEGLVLGSGGGFKTVRSGVLHGPSVEIRFGGAKEQGSYVEGKRSGPWTFFYKSGAKSAEGGFARGKRHGHWTEWHEDGAKKSEGMWSLDKKTGEWWSGTASGRRFSAGTYKNDKRHGMWQDTWEDGTTKRSEWKNGVQVGV